MELIGRISKFRDELFYTIYCFCQTLIKYKCEQNDSETGFIDVKLVVLQGMSSDFLIFK